ncbi:MAG: hypothetical protein RL536_278 [Candidatus Parcubacteria bacterium]
MKILIVEDDKDLAAMLEANLKSKSYSVDLAPTGGDGSFMGKIYDYDAILLDYSLPKKDGLAVCKEIRAAGKTTPIIFMSVTDAIETKIAAFDHGADDYIVKPFAFEELQARLRAIHRRPNITRKPILTVGDIVLNQDTRLVTRAGRNIPLTRKEFGVLEFLMQNQGTLVSRVLIMEHVWTSDSDLLSNTVETHIRNLRRKLSNPAGGSRQPNYIQNVPCRGYIMSAV